MRGGFGLWLALAAGCGAPRAGQFVDRLEEGRAVLIDEDGEVEERVLAGGAREGDFLVDARPSAESRSRAEARIRALRERLGARPLEAGHSLEHAP